MRLGLLVVRLRKISLPRRGNSVPWCRSTVRFLLDRHLVRRRRLVHRPLVLPRLVLRRRVVLCVDAVRLVVDEVPRRRLQSPGLLCVVDLRGEASRSAVDVATGLHVDVVLVVNEVPRRRLQPPGLLRAYHCKGHQRASSPLLRVYREGGVSRRRPQGRHIRLHGIRVRCGNNATKCSTHNQGSAGHARSRPMERSSRTRDHESQRSSSLQAYSALCRSRWTEANQFEMGVEAQADGSFKARVVAQG